ncbi:CorA family divalent cation transporter [Massilia polaris]
MKMTARGPVVIEVNDNPNIDAGNEDSVLGNDMYRIVLRDLVRRLDNAHGAQVTIRQNEVVKRLAGWGAILAVPTMVFSLYGMNFDVMPELKWRWSYPTVMLGIVAVSAYLHRRLKRAAWL